jgi:hypothetical protein
MFDRIFGHTLGVQIGSGNMGKPTLPSAPTIDDAQTASQQSTDLMRQRRGVLANIYAGNGTGGGAAPTATKTALGT